MISKAMKRTLFLALLVLASDAHAGNLEVKNATFVKLKGIWSVVAVVADQKTRKDFDVVLPKRACFGRGPYAVAPDTLDSPPDFREYDAQDDKEPWNAAINEACKKAEINERKFAEEGLPSAVENIYNGLPLNER